VDDDVGDLEAPAGAQDAVDLGEDRLLIRHEVDDIVRDHDVDRLVAQRQRLDQPLVELDVGEAQRIRAFARAVEHRGGHFDADRRARGARRRRRELGHRAMPLT
jgi:hypothetical protein